MKKTFFLLIVFCAALIANAQAQNDEPTAILQHGDQTTVYTTANAFQLAYNAAVNGDVITLSAGTFVAPTFRLTKSISIYGAGFEQVETTGTDKTIINGMLTLESISNAIFEGLYVQGDIVSVYGMTNTIISRCYVAGKITTFGITDSQINQCYIEGAITKGSSANYLATNLHVSNTSFSWIGNYASPNSIYIDHCLVRDGFGGTVNATYNANTYTNCIFTGMSIYTGQDALMTNCIYVNEAYVNQQAVLTNCYQVDLAEIFADGENADYSVERTYELQQPNVLVGTDGTPIGPSGGLGWIKHPSTPVVKDLQLNVERAILYIDYDAEVR